MNIEQTAFEKPLIDIIDEACARYADRICLQFGDERYTYRQVHDESIRVAESLNGAGFHKGMHAAIYSLNSAKAFIVTLGIIRAGGVWIPVNPRNSEVDNIAVLGKLGCDVLFYQDTFRETLQRIEKSTGGLTLSVCFEDSNGQQGLHDWLANSPKKPIDITRDSLDTITIPMTGGTTGLPKGVMLSDRNFQALSYALSADLMNGEAYDAVFLCAAPMTHVGGRIVLTSMAAGPRYVIKEQVDLQDILHTIEREGVTDIFLPPTAIYGLLAQPNVRRFDYSSLRHVVYGSAPMSIAQLKKAIDVFGPVMMGGFGQTECPMKITQLRPEDHFVNGAIAPDSRLRSVGRATPISEVAIVDELAMPLPVGTHGEIAVKGGNVSEGYFNAPDETAKIRKNGWHLTGDIGYMDKDGFVFIVDRKKDMIITGGFNVYSAEVELGVGSIDGIAGVAVIGVPSDKWGEEVKAVVQLAPDAKLSEAQLLDITKEKMGSVKAPKSFDFVDDFPKTPLGKIDKKAIREKYWQGVERAI